jgi:cysteinyl-tRNA synthetase
MLKLYNTLSRKKEAFKPLKKTVGLYACGPTVYDYAHIGNLRSYLFEDVLKRTLLYNDFKVKHVINITDVGHLTSDEDTGDDKLEKRAKEKRKSAWEIAEYYTLSYKEDTKKLNILPPTVYIKATDTIKEQIDLIKQLEKKGFTYIIKDGIYFDTTKLKGYGKLARLKKVKLIPGMRVDVKDKKTPTDFALWKFSSPKDKRQMEWESPWGVGFPGWHTECVVMSKMLLGVPFDIHCGGVDHIPVHHTNEIAQSNAVFNNDLANFWIHGEFLNIKDAKMSKSKGNFYILEDLEKKGFSPLSYRYLCLTSHYRSKMNFSEEALMGAENGLRNLQKKVLELGTKKGKISPIYKEKFIKAINDDLNTPKALDVVWSVLKDNKITPEVKRATIEDFDKILGLNLSNRSLLKKELELEEEAVPEEIKSLAKEREECREKKDFKKSDEIRKKIATLGYLVEDTKNGFKIKKI